MATKTFKYISTSGAEKIITAADANEALRAPDIGVNSGVQEMQATPAPTSASSSDTTPETTAGSTLADRYSKKKTDKTKIDPLTKAKEDLAKQLGLDIAPPDENKIREQMIQQNQAYIDAVNRRYDDLVKSDTKEGLIREDQTRSFNIRSGNIGGDFAGQETEKTRSANREIIDADNAKRNLELQAIYSKINQSARDEVESKRQTALGNAGKRIELLESLKTDNVTRLTDAAKNRLPFKDFKDAELDTGEKVFDYIKRTTGKTDLELETLYNASLPDDMKVKYENEYVKLKNGNVGLMRYGIDPTKGTLDKKEYDLGINYDVFKNEKPIEADGVLYTRNTDGTLTPLTRKTEDSPASYKEWTLAGKPGTYAEFIKKGGTSDNDTVGQDLKDAMAAKEGGADLQAIKRRFIETHPTQASVFDSYFGLK